MTSFEAELLKVIPRTNDVSSFRFSNPMQVSYKAGQYSILTIRKDGKDLTRVFSISSSPTEKGYLEYTTRLRDSDFKNALRGLNIGDRVRLETPFGIFILDEDIEKIGMLSGGMGITPFRSMIKYCTDKGLQTKITLLYGCHSETDIVFRDELEGMQRQNPNLKIVYTLVEAGKEWRGYKGYIDAAMVKEEISDYRETVLYCCGPPVMVKVVEDELLKIGVKKENIRKENFAGY